MSKYELSDMVVVDRNPAAETLRQGGGWPSTGGCDQRAVE